jgi:hypothetical protein
MLETGIDSFILSPYLLCVLRRSCARSSSIGVKTRIGDFTQLEGGGHTATAGERDAPASRVWDLGDQAVGVKAAQESTDLTRLLERVASREDWRGCELVAQVAVGEAMQCMLAAE